MSERDFRPGDVALIDAGGANLGSVRNALARVGALPRLVRDADELGQPERIILPGVGAASTAMRLLRERGLDIPLRASERPLLGICVGMQLLFERSDEGDVECLGIVPGRVEKLRGATGVRVPHMGWNRLRIRRDASVAHSRLLDGIDDGAFAYFVHSYAAIAAANKGAINGNGASDACVLAYAEHGQRFAAVVAKDNRYGVQFHPERSSAIGRRLLANFLRLPA